MNEELLVRVYQVGCGDCIFLRIPDGDRPRHILIDCGNFFGDSVSLLRNAVANVIELLNDPDLPDAQQGRLDLLVATHQHWDHLKGFEGALKALKGIEIERIWISVAMEPGNAGAQGLHALQAALAQTVNELVEERGLFLDPALYATFLLSLSTAEASRAVRELLPQHHGIEPLYIYRGVEAELTEEQRQDKLLGFADPATRLHILAPEKDIDQAYVNPATALLEEFQAGTEQFLHALPEDQRLTEPANISRGAFRQLKDQLLYTSLMAASQENGAVNNTSIALLVEWRGHRLLFPGDAEHRSWELMWEHARPQLSAPLSFLKVAHHGSHNGTPYNLGDSSDPLNEVLDALLPRENAANAQAVVTTLAGRIHAPINPVPFPDLMNELATRVSNTVEYPDQQGRQPQRTDLEPGDWIDIRLTPADGQ